jgi:hypothetical protein
MTRRSEGDQPGYNVVAMPFPVWPGRVVYSDLAKVL